MLRRESISSRRILRLERHRFGNGITQDDFLAGRGHAHFPAVPGFSFAARSGLAPTVDHDLPWWRFQPARSGLGLANLFQPCGDIAPAGGLDGGVSLPRMALSNDYLSAVCQTLAVMAEREPEKHEAAITFHFALPLRAHSPDLALHVSDGSGCFRLCSALGRNHSIVGVTT